MKLRAFGLRPRVLIALVLTAVVTLAVAALGLLGPLEQRLRNDGENSVLTAVSAAKSHFAGLPLDPSGEPNRQLLQGQEVALRRATGAQVTLLDPLLKVVGPSSVGPDEDVPNNYSDVKLAMGTEQESHTLSGDALIVAAPIVIKGRQFGLDVRKRLSYVSSAVDTVQTAFLEAAAAGLLVALLLGIWFSGTLLRRLERLRDATRHIEREGVAVTPGWDSGRDEIGELARAFASMHEQLRRQESARRAFVATASHELRTPLTSLDGMLELLEDDLNADHLDLEDARERTARAREQSQRLSRLATDLLDLSRLDAAVELRHEPLELGELCRAVAAEFELRAGQAHVRLSVAPPTAPVWVAADPGAVAQIIRILIDNALRVAPPDSSIDVGMTAGPEWAIATVSDQGPGVPEDEAEIIFERFQRGTSTGGRSGFGLGLAIGRELAQRMGGSLRLRDRRRPGRGGAGNGVAPVASAVIADAEIRAARRPATGTAAAESRAAVAVAGRDSPPGSGAGPGACFELSLPAAPLTNEDGPGA